MSPARHGDRSFVLSVGNRAALQLNKDRLIAFKRQLMSDCVPPKMLKFLQLCVLLVYPALHGAYCPHVLNKVFCFEQDVMCCRKSSTLIAKIVELMASLCVRFCTDCCFSQQQQLVSFRVINICHLFNTT